MRLLTSVIATLSLTVVACSDAAGPPGSTKLCPEASWAGIQREGQSWEAIPVTPSTVSLQAGERLGLAKIDTFGDTLKIFYVTAEQAEATFQCKPPATKELTGTLTGGGSSSPFGDVFTIAMGPSRTLVTSSSFVLHVPNGTADLVVTRRDVVPLTIIRRDVNYGSTIPVLDFSSTEAFSLQTNTLTVLGAGVFERSAMNEVITKNGTQGTLGESFINHDTALAMYSVPASRLQGGEVNVLTVFAGIARSATVYYRVPSDRTVELGPQASAATLTRIGTLPNLTSRADQPSQAEYGSQISFMLCGRWPSGGIAYSLVTITKEYLGGTPVTWSFTTPNLLAVQGFPTSRPDLRQTGLCETTVTDRPYLFSPLSARDGDTYRSAGGDGVLFPPL